MKICEIRGSNELNFFGRKKHEISLCEGTQRGAYRRAGDLRQGEESFVFFVAKWFGIFSRLLRLFGAELFVGLFFFAASREI